MKGKVIGLGMLDGVHRAHRQLIEKVLEVGDTFGLTSCIHLFTDHPLAVLTGKHPGLLTTLEEKEQIIRPMGVEEFYYQDFTPEFAAKTPEEFADYLRDEIGAVCVVTGFNYSFAKGGRGDSVLLGQLCNERNMGLYVIPPVKLNDTVVSSTAVRESLRAGDLLRANALLGYDYFCSGRIVPGRQVGRKLGYPTANITVPRNKILPPNGVYITHLTLGERVYPALTNIGVRPTFSDGEQVSVESFILGFEGEIYARPVRISFLRFLRTERRFDSPEALKRQIAEDVLLANSFFRDQSRK